VELFLDYDADVNIMITLHRRNPGGSALFFAIQNKNIPIIKMLLDHGADPNAINYNRVTPFMLATESGDQKIIELIEKARYKKK
jgi:ankyrin repeat protein